MKYILAPDSFKGSATAKEICQAMAAGIRKSDAEAEIVMCPMADGGEGTVRSLVDSYGGDLRRASVTGPDGSETIAEYGVIGGICLIEAAETSGLTLLSKDNLNPLKTSTKGLGELIIAALDEGLKEFIIGIGGTGTNDGGCGMAAALGYRFLDEEGREIDPAGGNLDRVVRIDTDSADSRIRSAKFRIACDVDNPLCGDLGASAVFGPQKGATPEMVKTLDKNLAHLANLWKEDMGLEIADVPGAGAAGGLGAGAIAFLGGELSRGVELIAKMTGLEEKIADANVVFTGEGRCDSQTLRGKVVYGVAKCAKSHNVPVAVIAGSVEKGSWQQELVDCGVVAFSELLAEGVSLEYSRAHAAELIEERTATLCRENSFDI